jgi:hypothetical protein
MSNGKTLKTLFTTLHGSLPYEYDVLYVNTENTGDSIEISKAGSGSVIYITENAPDDGGTFDIFMYDDAFDSEPAEITQWDGNDPDLTLIDLIAYIEENL